MDQAFVFAGEVTERPGGREPLSIELLGVSELLLLMQVSPAIAIGWL
jgi:hypothetical protein